MNWIECILSHPLTGSRDKTIALWNVNDSIQDEARQSCSSLDSVSSVPIHLNPVVRNQCKGSDKVRALDFNREKGVSNVNVMTEKEKDDFFFFEFFLELKCNYRFLPLWIWRKSNMDLESLENLVLGRPNANVGLYNIYGGSLVMTPEIRCWSNRIIVLKVDLTAMGPSRHESESSQGYTLAISKFVLKGAKIVQWPKSKTLIWCFSRAFCCIYAHFYCHFKVIYWMTFKLERIPLNFNLQLRLM